MGWLLGCSSSVLSTESEDIEVRMLEVINDQAVVVVEAQRRFLYSKEPIGSCHGDRGIG